MQRIFFPLLIVMGIIMNVTVVSGFDNSDKRPKSESGFGITYHVSNPDLSKIDVLDLETTKAIALALVALRLAWQNPDAATGKILLPFTP